MSAKLMTEFLIYNKCVVCVCVCVWGGGGVYQISEKMKIRGGGGVQSQIRIYIRALQWLFYAFLPRDDDDNARRVN